jgi:hypothetical protein
MAAQARGAAAAEGPARQMLSRLCSFFEQQSAVVARSLASWRAFVDRQFLPVAQTLWSVPLGPATCAGAKQPERSLAALSGGGGGGGGGGGESESEARVSFRVARDSLAPFLHGRWTTRRVESQHVVIDPRRFALDARARGPVSMAHAQGVRVVSSFADGGSVLECVDVSFSMSTHERTHGKLLSLRFWVRSAAVLSDAGEQRGWPAEWLRGAAVLQSTETGFAGRRPGPVLVDEGVRCVPGGDGDGDGGDGESDSDSEGSGDVDSQAPSRATMSDMHDSDDEAPPARRASKA